MTKQWLNIFKKILGQQNFLFQRKTLVRSHTTTYAPITSCIDRHLERL